jgi:hypothetical protein
MFISRRSLINIESWSDVYKLVYKQKVYKRSDVYKKVAYKVAYKPSDTTIQSLNALCEMPTQCLFRTPVCWHREIRNVEVSNFKRNSMDVCRHKDGCRTTQVNASTQGTWMKHRHKGQCTKHRHKGQCIDTRHLNHRHKHRHKALESSTQASTQGTWMKQVNAEASQCVHTRMRPRLLSYPLCSDQHHKDLLLPHLTQQATSKCSVIDLTKQVNASTRVALQVKALECVQASQGTWMHRHKDARSKSMHPHKALECVGTRKLSMSAQRYALCR